MIVYLDSQDYSKLTDPRNASDLTLRSFADRIRKTANAGAHVFPFSNLHVQEAIHSNEGGKSLAQARARFIKEISRMHVMAPLEHVIQIEAAKALREIGVAVRESAPSSVQRTDGVWWPWEFLADQGTFDLEADAIAPATADLMRTANRQQRRAYQRALPAIRARAKEARLKDIAPLMAELVEKLPDSPRLRDVNFIRSYLLGKVGNGEFYDAMMMGALDLEAFFGWVVDRLTMDGNTFAYLKTCGYDLCERLEKEMLSDFRFPSRFKGNIELEDAYENSRNALIKAMSDGIKRALIKVGTRFLEERGCIEDAESAAKKIGSYDGQLMPGIDLCGSCCAVWIRQLTTPLESRQKPLRSDILDIFHAIYLPYVDVFRADARFANVLRQTKTTYFSRVEPSLGNLVERLC